MDLNYLLRAKNFRTKKRLGQNFLVDKSVIDKTMEFVTPDDIVLEIGPGLGFLTEQLVQVAKKVVAVEIDEDAIKILNKNLGDKENLTVIQNDILKTNLEDIFEPGTKVKVIANIPYYITSPILAHLLGEVEEMVNKNRSMVSEIVLMVQYEVAKRIVADNTAESKEYGMLSILSNFWADTKILHFVSKKSFFPSPKVDSALVHLKINDMPRCPISKFLKRTMKACFLTRRKNIKNSLQNAGFLNVDDVLKELNIDSNFRGERLSIQGFYDLSIALEKAQA